MSPPTSENPTVIDASGTYTVTISSADVAQSLTVNDTGVTVLDTNGGSLTLGGALTVNAGIFEFDGGILAGVSTLTIGTAGVVDAANPSAAVVIDTGNPVINDGTIEVSGGDLVIQDALNNEGGTISIQGGTIELAVANSLTVNFSGTGGTLQLDSTVTGGALAGVDAASTGTAAITITGAGSVTSTGAEGIEATSAGGNISITADGSVSGTNGIDATQNGDGNITISVGGAAGTTITGTAYYGIIGLSFGSGDVSVSTTGADTIVSNSSGLVAESQASTIASSAGSSITVTAYGTINSGSQLSLLGYAPDGIVAGYLPNAEGEPDANVNGSVTVNNFANITAAGGSSGGAGIDAFNFGNGDVTVNDNYGAGAVASTSVSGVQYGIEAIADSGGTGNVTVNIGTDAAMSSSTESSGLFGVEAFSTDTGNITVTMSTGDNVTSGSDGIAALNGATTIPAADSSVISVTADGTIDSGSTFVSNGLPPAGIAAGYAPNGSSTVDLNVTGTVTVNSYANITAAAGWGIDAFNFGNGNVTVNAFAGTVYGEEYGIAAYGEGGSGNVAVNVSDNVNVSTSNTTGLYNSVPLSTNVGILAFSLNIGNTSVTTSAGDAINSGSDGIAAINDATTIPAADDSTVSVTAYGTIDSGSIFNLNGLPPAGIVAGYGVTPDPNATGTVTINSYANITAAAGWGIVAFNYGTGNAIVTAQTGSSIAAPAYGIAAYAFDGGNASITNDGTVNAATGIGLQAQSTAGGTGNGTATIINDGSVIGAGTSADSVVWLSTDIGAATLINAGTITPASSSASGFAIYEAGGSFTIDNTGTITGEVASANTTFNNETGGVWNVSGSSTFNSGSTINDAGTINAVGNTAITDANITLNIGNAIGIGYLYNDDLTGIGATLTLGSNLTIDQTGTAAIYSTYATTAINDFVVSYATINASAAYTFYIQPDFFTNYGQINADASGGTLDIIPTGSFTNYGTVAVSNGENATIGSGFVSDTQPGSATNELAGIISVSGAGSSLLIAASSFTNDGTLQVDGSAALNINSNVENLGGMIETSGNDLSVRACKCHNY